jgi:DNA-binding response OmpR family regulator
MPYPVAACRILIVDDADLLLTGLIQLLSEIGHTVCGATTGREALCRLETQSFDLVLLDLKLPDIDGYTICRHIRQFYGIPVILMSGVNVAETRIDALAAGACMFVGKPFSLRELQDAIQETLTDRLLGSV